MPPSLRLIVRGRLDYIPEEYPLLKRVVAQSGDFVCIKDTFVVNGESISTVATADSRGRRLTPVSFCGPVPQGFSIVASPLPTSLDSRYFGAVPTSTLTRAHPIWTF